MAGVGDTTGRCTDVPETPILWLVHLMSVDVFCVIVYPVYSVV